MVKFRILCAILLIFGVLSFPVQAMSPDNSYLDETIPQYDFYARAEADCIQTPNLEY